MKPIALILILSLTKIITAQTITPQEILNKAIAFHDPNNNWLSFSGNFKVVMTTPNQSPRTSDIHIHIPAEYFKITATRDTVTTQYILDKETCEMQYNSKVLSESEAKSKNMSCDRGNFMKNYYTYLYGLPMKLKDPGTHIDRNVKQKHFKGKDYLVLKASYDKTVGTDVWYFYFNPETYAMEIYQFFRTDDNGLEKSDTGEYIILKDLETINGIKMPKVRAWYYNKNDVYLGTDTLVGS